MSEGSGASAREPPTLYNTTNTNKSCSSGQDFSFTHSPPHLQFKTGFVWSNHSSHRTYNHIGVCMVQAHTRALECSKKSSHWNWPKVYFWGFVKVEQRAACIRGESGPRAARPRTSAVSRSRTVSLPCPPSDTHPPRRSQLTLPSLIISPVLVTDNQQTRISKIIMFEGTVAIVHTAQGFTSTHRWLLPLKVIFSCFTETPLLDEMTRIFCGFEPFVLHLLKKVYSTSYTVWS